MGESRKVFWINWGAAVVAGATFFGLTVASEVIFDLTPLPAEAIGAVLLVWIVRDRLRSIAERAGYLTALADLTEEVQRIPEEGTGGDGPSAA